MNKKVFLISGKARSGKHTVANIIKDYYERQGKKCAITIYAKYIKQYAIDYFNWDGKEESKPRELLQKLGTDIIKDKLGMKDFQVRRMIEDIKVLQNFFDIIIVPDTRFIEEIEDIKETFANVYSIRINRHNYDNGLTIEEKNHPSEIALDNYKNFDYQIDSTSINDIKIQVENILKDVN